MMTVRALSAIGGRNVQIALKEALATETDETVKEAMKEALE
jgi:hypothetical protein